MEQGPQRTSAFTYLYNDHARVLPLVRTGPKEAHVRLPNPITGTPVKQTFAFSEKEQRTVLIFDGDIPWQGLPRSATHVCREELGSIPLSPNHLRNERPYEEAAPANCRNGTLVLYRHTLLVQASTILVRRYRPGGNLARYSLIEVERRGEDSVVTWRNSSY